jgi:hypothetical protein
MSDNSMAPVLSFLPNTTYDLPAFDLSFGIYQPLLLAQAQMALLSRASHGMTIEVI